MKTFNNYQKIPEFSGLWTQDERDARLLRSCDWCVTEKIHGANFCWFITTTEIQCAKRKAVFAETDEFFNYQRVKERLKSLHTEDLDLIKSVIQEDLEKIIVLKFG